MLQLIKNYVLSAESRLAAASSVGNASPSKSLSKKL